MNEIKNILYPSDFSERHLVALPYALDLASRYNASVHVLHVVDDTYQYFTAGQDDIMTMTEAVQDQLTAARKKMDSFVEQNLPEFKDRTIRHVTNGKPFLEIVRYANDHHIDMIVMSTHGYGALASILLGSVAEKVVRKSPCPVLTVRHPDYKFQIEEKSKGQDI